MSAPILASFNSPSRVDSVFGDMPSHSTRISELFDCRSAESGPRSQKRKEQRLADEVDEPVAILVAGARFELTTFGL
jgi:hypothetical protein